MHVAKTLPCQSPHLERFPITDTIHPSENRYNHWGLSFINRPDTESLSRGER
jgi:hypothetical protein